VALEGGDVDHRTPDGALIRITLPPGLRSGDKVVAGQWELCVYTRAEGGVIVRGDDVWMTVKVAPGLLKKGGRPQPGHPARPPQHLDRQEGRRARPGARRRRRPAGPRPPGAGHLFVRLSASPGLADSAALALLRRFAAAWAA
jgi:curved DNA-binding protein